MCFVEINDILTDSVRKAERYWQNPLARDAINWSERIWQSEETIIYVESDILELKRILTKDLKKEVIAFANTIGGKILIGVEDDGEVIGVVNSSEICEQISSMIKDGIKPDITTMMEMHVESIKDKRVIELNVQRGTHRPYYQSDKGLKPSGVSIRLGNTSIPATDTAIRNMIEETDGTKYEDVRSINQELTFEYAKREFVKKELLFEMSQQKTLGVIGDDKLYTNLGLLLSDQCQHMIAVSPRSEFKNL